MIFVWAGIYGRPWAAVVFNMGGRGLAMCDCCGARFFVIALNDGSLFAVVPALAGASYRVKQSLSFDFGDSASNAGMAVLIAFSLKNHSSPQNQTNRSSARRHRFCAGVTAAGSISFNTGCFVAIGCFVAALTKLTLHHRRFPPMRE